MLLRNLGWEKEFEDTVLAKPPLSDVAAACAELVSSGAVIAGSIGDGSEDNDPLFEELLDVIGGLQDLVAGRTGSTPPTCRRSWVIRASGLSWRSISRST